MEKEILEIIARAPEISQLGQEYIGYLILRLLCMTGLTLIILGLITFGIYKFVTYTGE